jgi:ketosteroid isomerase-like protein
MSNEVEQLARRVQLLEDQAALRTLMITGWRALDHKDFDTWADCWAEDATFEFSPWGVLTGREEIRAKVETSEEPYVSMIHHILNLDFHVEGDTATGVGFMWFVGVGAGQETSGQYNMGGPYEWRYRRDSDHWRISAMKLGVWYSHGEDNVSAFSS